MQKFHLEILSDAQKETLAILNKFSLDSILGGGRIQGLAKF